MTEIEAYQEYIRCKHNAFCKAVIRYAAIGKIIRLRQKWERKISLDYLTNEKFVQFAEPEPDEEHPFIVCGQTVLLCNAALAAALSAQPKQTQEVILRYYFLRQRLQLGLGGELPRLSAQRPKQGLLCRNAGLQALQPAAVGALQSVQGYECRQKLVPFLLSRMRWRYGG